MTPLHGPGESSRGWKKAAESGEPFVNCGEIGYSHPFAPRVWGVLRHDVGRAAVVFS